MPQIQSLNTNKKCIFFKQKCKYVGHMPGSPDRAPADFIHEGLRGTCFLKFSGLVSLAASRVGFRSPSVSILFYKGSRVESKR